MAWTLTDAERERLNCFPTDIPSEDIITFFTLTASDKEQIPITTNASNRLGFVLQLCTLRYLGFCPDKWTPVPAEVLDYLARQLGIDPNSLSDYGERAHTRTDHLQSIQEYLGFRKATQADFTSLAAWLCDRALEHDKPSLLLQLLCEKLYKEKIIRPGITRLEKMVATARSQAQAETYKRVSPLLTPEYKKFLDELLVSDEITNRTRHAWLSKGATSNTAPAMLFCLDKLAFLRKQNIDTWDMSLLTPNRLKFLAQIAKRSTNQAIQRMPEERRYPILLAFLNQSLIEITDETIEIFDRCLWDCYNGAKNDLEAFKKEVYKSSNEKLIVTIQES
jgi:TnpA family transposase